MHSGITITVNPEYPHLRALADRLASDGVPADAEMIYKGRNRVYALTLYTGERVNIKAFKIPKALNPYIYTLIRKSKAERSYENARKLISMGFGSPEPLAYIEVHDGVRLKESYYVCRQLEAQNMRHWEEKADCEPLLRALADEIVRLQKSGVWHKDFSPGNILYTGNNTDGYRFYYIDLNRMQFNVTDKATLMRMFRAINLDENETRRLGRYFGEAAGLDPEKTGDTAVGELRHYLEKKRRLRALKSIVKGKKKK